MREEADCINAINRAARAQVLLEDELLVSAFRDIEEFYTEQWRGSSANDEVAREKIWVTLKLLKQLRSTLEGYLETGVIARSRLAEIRERIKNIF